MIPIRLTLSNFMCYRRAELSFEGIHTACISGDNGSGKSALIDAMTWALWGETRARSDSDLIHLGQTEMQVEFEFGVAGQTYRIIRRQARAKRPGAPGKSDLQFQVAAPTGFKSITGDTKSQTQDKVIAVLHMEYDTFINSAYLRQGHADEFTIARPAVRKQVLASILGLSLYDELEAEARERARQQETEKGQLDSSLREIAEELARRPACEADLLAAQEQLTEAEGALATHESRRDGLRREKESLDATGSRLAQMEDHIRATEKGLARWQEQLDQHRARLDEYEKVVGERAEIEAGFAELADARKVAGEFEQKLRLATRLNDRKHELDKAIIRAGEALVREHAVALGRISDLEARAGRLPLLKSELGQVQALRRQVAAAERSANERRQSGQEQRAQVHRLEADVARAEREISAIEEKLRLVLAGTETRCPLCETDLGAEGIKHIQNTYEADRQARTLALQSGRAELTALKTALQAAENETARLEAALDRDRAAAQARASLVEKAIAEAEEAAAGLAAERHRLDDIEERMARRDFAPAEQQALAELEAQLGQLGYDAHQHDESRERLAALEKYEEPKRKLEEALRLMEEERVAAARAGEASREMRQGIEADLQQKAALSTELARLPGVAAALGQAEMEYQQARAGREQAQGRLFVARANLDRCTVLESRRAEKEKLRDEAARLEDIYRELTQAFGKKGIPALLIEWALPEIETEANRLLGRMTDNRMHVKMETQRESQKGDALETLDINISDELGTRNYEMYSGGEAFRINFAIRIALSRLLARRAGAPLPTLIIDEGFGSQDATGIEKLIEAITSIQDDFEKILVTTHIDELRDAFPTRIDVVKTADGSTVEVG